VRAQDHERASLGRDAGLVCCDDAVLNRIHDEIHAVMGLSFLLSHECHVQALL
jgi:hypothetical protein